MIFFCLLVPAAIMLKFVSGFRSILIVNNNNRSQWGQSPFGVAFDFPKISIFVRSDQFKCLRLRK